MVVVVPAAPPPPAAKKLSESEDPAVDDAADRLVPPVPPIAASCSEPSNSNPTEPIDAPEDGRPPPPALPVPLLPFFRAISAARIWLHSAALTWSASCTGVKPEPFSDSSNFFRCPGVNAAKSIRTISALFVRIATWHEVSPICDSANTDSGLKVTSRSAHWVAPTAHAQCSAVLPVESCCSGFAPASCSKWPRMSRCPWIEAWINAVEPLKFGAATEAPAASKPPTTSIAPIDPACMSGVLPSASRAST